MESNTAKKCSLSACDCHVAPTLMFSVATVEEICRIQCPASDGQYHFQFSDRYTFTRQHGHHIQHIVVTRVVLHCRVYSQIEITLL